MNATIYLLKKVILGPKTREMIINIIAYLLIFLFLYTAFAKFSDLESFGKVLSRSPLVGGAASYIAWIIPAIEAAISIMLIIPVSRIAGIYASLCLMILFTGYLLYMVLTASTLPCHCGGVISSMSWNEHILFNGAFIALAITAIVFNKQNTKIH